VFTDLEPVAVEDVSLELAVDAKRTVNHQGAMETRSNADQRARRWSFDLGCA
jgi:hypothetical protein